jgi:hypothetical protein
MQVHMSIKARAAGWELQLSKWCNQAVLRVSKCVDRIISYGEQGHQTKVRDS